MKFTKKAENAMKAWKPNSSHLIRFVVNHGTKTVRVCIKQKLCSLEASTSKLAIS